VRSDVRSEVARNNKKSAVGVPTSVPNGERATAEKTRGVFFFLPKKRRSEAEQIKKVKKEK
jgi:hypothetical protein